MNCTASKSSQNDPTTLYQHLCKVTGLDDESIDTPLFSHIEETKNIADQGKWYFVTNVQTQQQAHRFLDERLHALCDQFSHDHVNVTTHPFTYRPRQTNRPSAVLNRYATTLKTFLSETPLHPLEYNAKTMPQDTAHTSTKDTNSPAKDPSSLPPSEVVATMASVPKSPAPTSDFQVFQTQLTEVKTQLQAHGEILKTVTNSIQAYQALLEDSRNIEHSTTSTKAVSKQITTQLRNTTEVPSNVKKRNHPSESLPKITHLPVSPSPPKNRHEIISNAEPPNKTYKTAVVSNNTEEKYSHLLVPLSDDT